MRKPTILEQWNVTTQELTELVNDNGSLRGILLGYVAELKFKQLHLQHPAITDKGKTDDHNRKRKGDRNILYKDREIKIEVKSLQTKTVVKLGDDVWRGASQVDASDRRKVIFPDQSSLETTCLLRGEFDILAVNCYAFGNQWRFAFAKNQALPASPYVNYTVEQRQQLLASLSRLPRPHARMIVSGHC